MTELVFAAQRLRLVKEACVDFLILWAVDALMTETLEGDRLRKDVLSANSESELPVFSKFRQILDD